MRYLTFSLAAGATLALAACGGAPTEAENMADGNDAASNAPETADATAATSAANPCPIIEDTGWKATIRHRTQSVGTITVEGHVAVPIGHSVNLGFASSDQGHPPTYRFELTIEDRGSGSSAGTLWFPVSAESGVASSTLRAVVIECGGQEVERITRFERGR